MKRRAATHSSAGRSQRACRHGWRFFLIVLLGLLLAPQAGWAAKKYAAHGLVIQIDRAHRSLLVSCDRIPGYMAAMMMPYAVRNEKQLDGLTPGTMIDFTLVVGKSAAYAERIRVVGFQSLEQDPLTTRRLKILNGMFGSNGTKPLAVGERVPDFALTDQNRQRVALSQFAGKVVAINFIYTRCPLPNYCFRLSNNFGNLQRRFRAAMGRNLIFLTVTFDPVHDTPETLANYSRIWRARPESWHFLTGPPAEIQRICGEFGVDSYPDDGFFYHSLHTAVIDRSGRLVANLEGNQFTADQLGDLLHSVMERPIQP